MINPRLQILPALLILSMLVISCRKELVKTKVTMMKPVYGLKEDVYNAIHSDAPRDVQRPGKMFLLGDYIYLTEVGKGIHIIDRTDPNNLQNVSFVPIPGNQDVAVKDNYLYADCATDLVVLDISQPTNVTFTKHLTDVFPDKYYQNGYYADNMHVIVDWVAVDTFITLAPGQQISGPVFADCLQADSYNTTAGQPGFTAPSGVGNSTARFGIVSDYLYAVTSSDLNTLNISNPASPVLTQTNNVGWNIETIYPFENHLFIGSQTGVYIYNIDNPLQPQQTSVFEHTTVCDPAIADHNFAYVTLRNGTQCSGYTNELNVVSIANISAPTLVQTLPLNNPRGLSKDGDLLFICDGAAGLKILNASNPSQTFVAQTIPLTSATNEVIASNNIAYVIAEKGLYLYDYSAYPNVVEMGSVGFMH